MSRIARLSLACSAVVGVVVLLVVPLRIAQGGYLNHVSGSWAALADDAAHGVLYRPLVSELGFGGTRNFPLHLVLHGALVRAGLSLRVAGHVLSLAAALMLVAGSYWGLRRRNAPALLAWSFGILVFGSRAAIMGAAGIRGDLLPVALGVLGLALVPRDEAESPVPSSLLLAAAVLAKPTLVWAPAGALLALAESRRWRTATKSAVLVALVVAGGLSSASLASHGSMLASFRACGSGGRFVLSYLPENFGYWRPGDVTWMIGGVALTLARGRRALTHPFCAGGLWCLASTLFVFTSRGTHVNHLVDSCVMGALAMGVAMADQDWEARWARLLLPAATLFGSSEAVFFGGTQAAISELEQATIAIPPGSGPILSEQPWIPLLAGERAFVLDSYSLLQTRHASPAVDGEFLHDLDERKFRAVVLLGRPERDRYWYDAWEFGVGFREHLLANYSFVQVAGAHAIYLPRAESGFADFSSGTGDGETVLDRMQRPGLLRTLVSRLRHR
jgi:hypothetical protein